MLAATLVGDHFTAPDSSFPEWIADAGGTAFFSAVGRETGTELWKSDGTAAGTVLVKDIVPGLADSAPASLVGLGGAALFSAYPGSGPRRQLWRSDGTAAGTMRITDAVDVDRGYTIHPNDRHLVIHDGAVYFAGVGADGSGTEVWRSDGTAAGTRRLKDIRPGPEGSSPASFVSTGGKLYFTANDGVHGGEWWVTDGTDAGTHMVKDIGPGAESAPLLGPMAGTGGRVFFATTETYPSAGVWASDGTEQGTVRLLTSPGRRVGLAPLGDRMLIFTEGYGHQGVYSSDGTAAGTVELKGFDSSFAALAQPVAGDTVVYFVRFDYGATFNELWKTDGTAAGTVRTDSLPMTPGNYGGAQLKLVIGDRLFFTSVSQGGGTEFELWSTDGTPGGAAMVEDIWPGPEGSDPQEFAEVGGVAFFSAYTPDAGVELWRSDGTAAGTFLVEDINPATLGSYPHPLADANGTLYTAVRQEKFRTQVVRTNAAGDGVAPVPIPALRPFEYVEEITGSGNVAYVLTYTDPGLGEYHLYRTDGTGEGTVLLKDFDSAAAIVDLDDNGTVLFRSSFDLWRSDGTPGGTVLVRVINPSSLSYATPFATLNGVVLLSADDGVHGNELWRSDGTAAGTVLVKDVVPGAGDSDPHPVAVAGGVAYFRVYPAPGVVELWKSDGTDAGTVRVAAVGDGPYQIGYPLRREAPVGAAVGDSVIFSAYDADRRLELWRTDGTEAGTVRIDPNPGTLLPASFAAFGGRVYFSGYNREAGRELWSTDGTLAGTRRVADVWPGPVGSDPQWLTASGGALWFSADSALYGRELWKYVADDEPPDAARVVARHVFYNHSCYDGNDAGAGAADDNAIATDKNALLASQDRLPGFDNVTSFDKGINGVIVDIAGLPGGGALSADDFDFGTARPPRDVAVRRGAGVNGSDRVTLIWSDFNIAAFTPNMATANGWLTITVKANTDTGLAAPDVFSFGNLIAETGDAGGALGWRVNAIDLAAVKHDLNAPATVTSRSDLNRDGRVNALDVALVKRNLGHTLPVPIPIATTAPAAPPRRVAEDVLM
jgi:ELWxxDGT repeat protein